MFMGLFGSDVGVKLSETDSEVLRAGPRDAGTAGLLAAVTLRHTAGQLSNDDAPPSDGLRQDTTFSYAVATSAEDVLRCFRWRLARGYC
jgi:hypothetical protein